MARSNWATLMWDRTGKLVPIADFGTIKVEPYKNWLYLKDEALGEVHEDSTYSNIVATIESGELYYKKHLYILAHRAREQQGCMFCVWSGYRPINETDTREDNLILYQGVCCYGYTSEAHPAEKHLLHSDKDDWDGWIGVGFDLQHEFIDWLHAVTDYHRYGDLVHSSNPPTVDEGVRIPMGDDPPSFDALGFNQGSMYLYESFGADREQAMSMATGEEKSVMMRILEGMGKEKEDKQDE